MTLDDPWLLLRAWAVAPALVLLASWGLGHLVERVAGMRLRALTLPAGYAAGIALTTSLLQIGLAGEVAVPIVGALALAGLVVAVLTLRRRRLPRARWSTLIWPAAGALVAFSVALAPLVGSGRSGILGYVLTNDSAAHISAIELIRLHGPVGYQSTLDSFHGVSGNFGVGYPIGSYVWPLFPNVLMRLDAFHLWMPVMAVTVAMLALVGYAALRFTGARPVTAGIMSPFVACPYILYSYLGQGGAKEVALAFTVYVTVALFVVGLKAGARWRSLVPAAIGLCAAVNVLGIGALAWLGPAGLVALVIALAPVRGRELGVRVAHLAGAAAIAAVLALPSLVVGVRFVETSAVEVLNDVGETGNLLAPVPWYESFGVWLSEDYRFPFTSDDVLTGIGIGIAVLLMIAGLVQAFRKRDVMIPLMLATGVAGTLMILRGRHGVYYDAKTYPVLAPGIALAAAAGVRALLGGPLGVKILGGVLTAALALGMAYSDALVYAGAWVTPKDRFQELMRIDSEFSGQGPILINEREEYAKYLLRDVQPWESWGSYYVTRGLLAGIPPAIPHRPDFDDYDPGHVQRFPLLLDRKRPGGSRPPANYEPAYETAHYRVWRRVAPAPRQHLALGDGETPSGTAKLSCASPDFRALLRRAREQNAKLTVARGEQVTLVGTKDWRVGGMVRLGPAENWTYRRGGTGIILTRLQPGRYDVWLEGSFGPGVRLLLGKQKIGEALNDLGVHDQFLQLGTLDVKRASPRIDYFGLGRPWWMAGSRQLDLVGPVAFVKQPSTRRVEEVDPADAERLCGEPLDWIELR